MAQIMNTRRSALKPAEVHTQIFGGTEPVRWEGFFRLIREKVNPANHWWVKYEESDETVHRRDKDERKGVKVYS